MRFENLPALFFSRAAEYADRPRYRYRIRGRWVDVSWRECAERVRDLAAGLVSCGLAPGEKVGLLAATRPEWMECDLAILACGALTVPVYPSSRADECGYILWNSESVMCVAENEAQRAKIDAVSSAGFELEGVSHRVALRRIATMEGGAEGDRVMSLEELRRHGATVRGEMDAEINRRMERLGRGDAATIVYTSGTTGPPKGVVQTHGNHLAALESLAQVPFASEGDIDFFFLPLAHSFARMVEYYGIWKGTVTAFAENMDTISRDMLETRPHFIPAVPRVYEKIHARIMAAREDGGALTRWIFDWALGVGQAARRYREEGRRVPAHLALQLALADRLVFRKVRAQLGGRVRYLISGGAPLAREIAEFFSAFGLLILEGYGLTETTPVLTVNRPTRYRLGTVGQPIANVTLRLAEDGEILARGPNIAREYYKRPEATAVAWDAEGWFHTGDIGEFDADGFLRITDRKKDLIKTSGGKYVAPQTIENMLKTQPHISQAVVIGDGRKYCVALLTLDVEQVRAWAVRQGIETANPAELARHPSVREQLEREVAAVNARLASFETIKHFRVVPGEFTQESGELTASLKVRRKVVTERYRGLIAEMYGD